MVNRLIFLLLFLSITCTVFSQNASYTGRFEHSSYRGATLLITTGKGYIEITPYKPNLIRVTYKANLKENEKRISTMAAPANVPAKYTDAGGYVSLSTSALKVTVDKNDLSVSFINNKGDTLTRSFNYIKTGKDSSAIDFRSDGKEAYYGGGSKAIYLNRRGQVLQNYNQAHWDYKFGQTDLNIAIPFLLSDRIYGIYMDNPSKSSFDICKADPQKVSYKTTAGLVSFFFAGGNTMDDVVSAYTYLTGRQPLPPRWALGYISSRYGYKSEKEVASVIDRTQKAGIPLDGVVFDLFWYKKDSLMGNFIFNRDSFPDPQRMLASFSKKGIKTVLISEPYITQKSENFIYAKSHNLLTPDFTDKSLPHIFEYFWAGPASLVDIFKPQSQQFYWDQYKAKIKDGVAGWWFDLLEPELSSDSLRFSAGTENSVHNIFPLIWTKNAFDGYRRDFPQSRIFILPRSGYAGMQRYSVFPWSGDIDRSFDGLKAQIPIILSMGLDGVGYMHFDAGGFTGAGEARKDPELYSRWLELAAFVPVMRTHADATVYSPEPIFWDDATRLRVTRYIKLRYRLLPYNYTLAYLNTITGRPLAMPVNYFEAGNKRLADINDEYLWGQHMLVAPVIVKGESTKKVLFPKGEWIGFNDLKIYRDSAEVIAPVDSLPLFVKAGSIITITGNITNTAQYNGRSVILKYYPGNTPSTVRTEWFYDDGKDPNSLKNGRYDLVNFTTSNNAGSYHIVISPKHLMSKHKVFSLIIPGKKVKKVTFSNKTTCKYINDADGSGNINFSWNGKPLNLDIKSQ